MNRILKEKFKIMVAGFCATLILFSSSCQLEEEIFSEIVSDGFGTTDEELSAVVAAAYASYGGFIGAPWTVNIISSDAGIVPTRGTDWAERGQWARLHEHDFSPDDFYAGSSWSALFTGINNVNRIIFQLEQIEGDGPIQTIKELRVLRALNYYMLMDIYGNLPIVSSFADAEANPATNTRAEVFEFVTSEVEAVINDMPEDKNTTYGVINKWVAHALLAKVYLNAEVFSGTAQWDKVILHTDAIINSGNYTLAPDFFDNFSAFNEGSPENIFVIVYDEVFAGGNQIAVRTLHYASQQTYRFTAQPWNGYASLQEFYNMFTDDDVRKGSFIVGQQYDPEGNEILDLQAEAADPNGQPLYFTPEITDVRNALRQEGVRIGKFEFEMGAQPQNMNNDFPLFRYGDILLTKAEALLKTGDEGGALILVNMIRQRAGVPDLTALSVDVLLDERGRETAFEGYRRQDLIRFGRFNDAWQFKPADPSDHVNLFPISSDQLGANPNLKQNPGYVGGE